MAAMQVLLCLLAYAVAALKGGSAQITCYTVPSVAGEFNCESSTDNFQAATIEECCIDNVGYFFEEGEDEACQACIVFGFFNGSEITLPEQSDPITLAIGFIKGGNVQQLTSIDQRNISRFGIAIGGNATEDPNADFFITPTSFDILGPDAREPFELTIFVRIDGVALETDEEVILTLQGLNTAGSAIIDPALPGQFVNPVIHVVIEDVENAILQFTESDYSNPEGLLFITPVVQLLPGIATNLTVQIAPVNITEALARGLTSALPPIPPFNPRRPNIATSVADFSTEPVEITFQAGSATIIQHGIAIVDDGVNEAEQFFALILEVVDAIDPDRVDLQSGRFASLARIIDDDPINVGFEQERYTVYEGFNSTGELIPIPIVKENGQESELTFEVTSLILIIDSSLMAAQRGEDFDANTFQRQDFLPDEQEIYFHFELFDDTPAVPALPEPTEAFQIHLLSLADDFINIGGSLFATATIVILDDDDVIIGFEQNVTRVNESQSILEICVRVLNLNDTQEIQEGLVVRLAANSIQGTAADPTDYSLQAGEDLFFGIIDDVIRRTCIEIEIISDGLLEGVEFFSIDVVPDPVVINFPSNVQLGPSRIVVEILDDDFVRIGFSPTDYTVFESDGVVTVFVAVLEGSLQRRVPVTFVTNANTITAGVEMTEMLLFDENTSEVQVNISISDDNIFEELLETFTVNLVCDPSDAVIVDPKTATVSIRDGGVMNFSNSVYSVGEAETSVSVQLLLSFDEGFNLTSQSFEVEFMTVNITAQGGRDYEEVFTNITINSTVTRITIPVFSDQAVEANEMFQCRITLISPTANVVITQTEAVVVIVDDDNIIVQFKEPEYFVMEGRQLSLGVQIMGENEIPLTVPFSVRGSATFQEDFNLTSGKDLCIVINPNIAIEPITTRCLLLNLSIVDDNIALEGTESILFELSDEGSQVRLGEHSSTTVLISDDDEIGVSLVDVLCRGSEAENPTVSVSRSGARIAYNLTLNVTVELLSEMNVTGCGPQHSDDMDFTKLEVAVTFDHNDVTEDTASFNLPIVDDDINEPEEMFFLSLKREANPTPGITLSNRMLACTLQDDDEISIHFGEENYTFQESEGPHLISLNATRSSQQEFLVAIEPEGDGNSIFTVTNAEFISFKPEQGNNSSMTISIDVADDNARGRNQSQVLRLQRRLQSPSFANCVGILQTCSSTTIHISDDDSVIIGFENTSRRVYLEKSVGEIQLCVSVMFSSIGNNFETFSLKVDTSDHSAKPGMDYIIDPSTDCLDNSWDSANNNSFLLGHFNHTHQRCCLNVTIVDDDNQEEMVIEFTVTLSQVDASRLLPIDIDPDNITVVIVDDDQCAIETTELEDALVCYNQSSTCFGSCIIVGTAEECCSKNGMSVGLLENDTCFDTLEICASPSPSQTPISTAANPPSSSNQSIVIIASVVASVGFILLVIVAVMTVLVVCLRRAQKTNNLNRKGSKADTLTTARDSSYEGTLPVTSAEFMQTLPRSLIVYASQLNLKDMLGQGEFGIVYKAFFKRYMNSETELVAVKTLKGLFTSRDVQGLVEEVLKMQAFHHLHVMSLTGVCLDSGAGPAIVMPYMANGSLLDYLRKERDNLLLDENASPNKVSETQKFLLNVCLQIAEGMEYLAQEKVIHRDLSARNCMIDAEGIIKVADFGLSVDVYSTTYYRQGKEQEEMKLPIRWMAVESIMDGIYTEKSDVWSFGVTMWEVYSGGKLPYPGVASPALIRHVASGQRLSKPENTACANEVYSCMQQCWMEVADERPLFHDLVTTISNILESISGYLVLQRSVSLIKRVKQDYSHSCHPKRPNSEMPILEEGEEGEELEGKEEAAKGAEQDSECGRGEEVEKEASSKAIRGRVMESVYYETTETVTAV